MLVSMEGVHFPGVGGWDDDFGKKVGGEDAESLDIDRDPQSFFTTGGATTFQHHYDAQQRNANRYVAALCVLHKNSVEISQSTSQQNFCLPISFAACIPPATPAST